MQTSLVCSEINRDVNQGDACLPALLLLLLLLPLLFLLLQLLSTRSETKGETAERGEDDDITGDSAGAAGTTPMPGGSDGPTSPGKGGVVFLVAQARDPLSSKISVVSSTIPDSISSILLQCV
mmetsp:Transcript_33093/g.60397  ORF Transcript_33093/g.60397 Transcript_33093/m.60397 type:complete len:123 (+) Transcript_33093:187-555(+)